MSKGSAAPLRDAYLETCAAPARRLESVTVDVSVASSPIYVALVGLDPLMRFGLKSLLGQDDAIRLVDGDEGEFERPLALDARRVVIAGGDVASSLLSGLLSRIPALSVLVLAHGPSTTYGMLLLAGGMTCVASNVAINELIVALHLTAHGERVFISASGERVERRYPMEAPALTKREREIFRYLSQGASHAAVALALGISVRTAHAHTAGICRKLAVAGKRDLVGMPIPSELSPATIDNTRTGG